MKKTPKQFPPVTGRDWLLILRYDLPDGCWWAVVVVGLIAVIKLLFFE